MPSLMKLMNLPVAALLTIAAAGPSGASVNKVISMLQSMAATAKKEKQDEEVAFATFGTWCTEESASLKKEIATDAQALEMLTTEKALLESEAAGLGESIVELEGSIASQEADLKAATAQREKDNAGFLEESKDFSESVEALESAIQVLQKENYDRPAAAAALVQLSDTNRIPEKARAILVSFVGMMSGSKEDQPEGLAYEAPSANAYEFQSTSIVDLLKRLKDDFRKKLGDCQKDEMNSKHAYDMVVQDLTDATANAKKEISEKTKRKSSKIEKAAFDGKQITATETSKAESEKTLAETTAECEEKQLSFNEKQQLRAEEIEAIEKAVEIMSSADVSGNADKYLALSQGRTSTSFVSLRATGVRHQVRDFLASEGQRLHSQSIALLAEKLAVDPFAKVKSLIDGMITRLLEEANQDADHEGFCDTEMGKSKITRTKLSEDIDALIAAVDEGKSTILKLTNRIAELEGELAALAKSIAEATSIRAAEKEKNAATVKDAKDAQAAVQAATAVLKEFYSKALTATALIQSPGAGVKMGSADWNSLANPDFEGTIDKGHKGGMQTFGATETGQQDKTGGVIALLEVILSDFSTLEADTVAAEASGKTAYDAFIVESSRDKATRAKQVEMDNTDKTSAEARLQEDTQDMKATQDELLAADRYYEKLVPQCIDQGMTFEERTKAREAEIVSLKEALKILNSEDIVTSA